MDRKRKLFARLPPRPPPLAGSGGPQRTKTEPGAEVVAGGRGAQRVCVSDPAAGSGSPERTKTELGAEVAGRGGRSEPKQSPGSGVKEFADVLGRVKNGES